MDQWLSAALNASAYFSGQVTSHALTGPAITLVTEAGGSPAQPGLAYQAAEKLIADGAAAVIGACFSQVPCVIMRLGGRFLACRGVTACRWCKCRTVVLVL